MHPHDHPDPARKTIIAAAVLLGLALYALTCAPGVLWQDSASFQHRVYYFNLHDDRGLAMAHASYVLLARAFTWLPLGDFAHRVNLFSAVCAAAALGVAVDLLLALTRSRLAAVAGATLLAVGHTFWTHAVITEVYGLYALCLLIELRLLERYFSTRNARWLIAVFFVNGLDLSNHLLAAFHLPAYLAVVAWSRTTVALPPRARMNTRRCAWAAAAYGLAASPYWLLIAGQLLAGRPWGDTVRSALFGEYYADKVLNLSFSFTQQAGRSLAFFAMNFPTPLVLLAPLGVRAALRRPGSTWFPLVAGVIFILDFVFAFRYRVPDQFVFFFPCYVLVALFVGCGVAALPASRSARFNVRRRRTRAVVLMLLALLPAAAYEIAPAALRRLDVAIGAKRDIPYRDTYAYFLRPRKNGEVSAARYCREALGAAAPDGLVIATPDATINNALAYVRDVERVCPDVTLSISPDLVPHEPRLDARSAGPAFQSFVARGAAFATSDDPQYAAPWLLDAFDLEPVGAVFRIVPRIVPHE